MKLSIDFDTTIKSNCRLIKTYIKQLRKRQKQQKITIKQLNQELSTTQSKINELESKLKEYEPYVKYALAILEIPPPCSEPFTYP